jgi:hypothetical protein
MSLSRCTRCGGHGTTLSGRDWSEEKCMECRGVGLVPHP